jgi:uncharacterized membrane protein
MTAATLFASSYIYVVALVLQSLLTNRGHYWGAFINSALFIGPANLYIIKRLPGPTSTLDELAYIAGGPFAAVTAMAAYRWWARRHQRQEGIAP